MSSVMLNFLDAKRLPKDVPTSGIVVYLYRPRADGQDTYDFLVFDQKPRYTVEEICIECSKELLIKPYALPLLALASHGLDNYWPALSRQLKNGETASHYVLRVRYRLPSQKVREIWEFNRDTIKYLFWQMLDDLVNDRIYGLEEKNILGYSSAAVYCTAKDEDKVDYTRFVPSSVKKQYHRPVKKLQLKFQLTKCVNNIKEDYKARDLDKSDAIRSMVLDLLKTSENYLSEHYIVKTQHDGVLWNLVVSSDTVMLKKVVEGKKALQNTDDTSIYSYDEILHCVGKCEDTFVLSLRPDPPKFLVVNVAHQMESILGVIDGYYRLVVNYYHLLNVMHTGVMVGPPSLDEMRKVRCHGPLTPYVCRDLLRNKDVGDYILKQHPDHTGSYMVTLNHGNPPQPKSFSIKRQDDHKFTCDLFSEPQTFSSVKEVMDTLIKTNTVRIRSQILVREETSLLLCRPPDVLTEDEELASVSSQVSDTAIRCVSTKAIHIKDFIAQGHFTQVLSAVYNHRKVAVKQLIDFPEAYRNGDLMEALQTGIYKASLWSDQTIVHIEALCLSPPFRAVMEYCQYGALDVYLRHCQRLIYLLDLLNVMYDVAMAIGYLQSLGDYHGNIRCRNLLVFSEKDGLKCKLGDPGVASLYKRARPDHILCLERNQWVAPEIINNQAQPSSQTDVYSFGITFIELFHHVKGEMFAFFEPLKTRPEHCPQKIWDLIVQCCAEPMDRKTQKDILRDVWQMIVSINPDGNRYYRIQSDLSPTSQQELFSNTSQDQRAELPNPVLNAKQTNQTNGSVPNHHHVAGNHVPPLPATMPPRQPASPDSSAGTLDPIKMCQSGASMFSYGSVNSTTPLIPYSTSGQTILSTLSDLNLSKGERSATITPSTSVESMTNSQQPLLANERLPSVRSNPPPLPAKRHTMEHTNQGFSDGSLPGLQPDPSPRSGPPVPVEQANINTIPWSRLKFPKEKRLGSGHYGVVVKAFLLPEAGGEENSTSYREVAVKKLQVTPTEDQELEFKKEINIMAQLDHANIVKIIGMCIQEGKTRDRILLVMEYVERGSMKTYIQKNVTKDPTKLLTYCLDVAEGMLYLSENSIIHRDLAARNILVTSALRMKISDFGLAKKLSDRDYYLSSSNRELPALWCALEGLKFNRFTTKGDVWSFGVTMWEIFSHGKKPSLDEDLREMYNKLCAGERLPCPDDCPQNVYDTVMYPCWEEDPTTRHGFSAIKTKLLEIIPLIQLESQS